MQQVTAQESRQSSAVNCSRSLNPVCLYQNMLAFKSFSISNLVVLAEPQISGQLYFSSFFLPQICTRTTWTTRFSCYLCVFTQQNVVWRSDRLIGDSSWGKILNCVAPLSLISRVQTTMTSRLRNTRKS